jgi:hypothetical protein
MTSSDSPTLLFLVELRCLPCGRLVGTLQTRQWPCHGPASLRLDGAHQAVPITDWSRLRCVRCRGNVYPDEVKLTRVYPRLSWDELDPPCRGRPPRGRTAAQRGVGDAADD